MFLFHVFLFVCFLINSGCCLFDASCKDGFHLGHQRNSYITYRFQTYQRTLDLSFDMRTTRRNGLVFYVRGVEKDFFSLYYLNGWLLSHYLCQGQHANGHKIGPTENDGNWYSYKYTINNERMEIQIFNEISKERIYNITYKGCENLMFLPPYYFGSIGKNHHLEVAKKQLSNHTAQFVGCIKNIVFGGTESPIETDVGVAPCTQQVEEGITFDAYSFYLLLDEAFHLEDMFLLQMKIKPKTNDGMLIFYQSENNTDSLVLELENCSLRLTAVHETEYFNLNGTLCDGEWHLILVRKTRRIYTIDVDHRKVGRKYQNYYNPDDRGSGRLYFGGGPTKPYAAIGHPYIGNINDFVIHGKQYDIFAYNSWGEVVVDLCPM